MSAGWQVRVPCALLVWSSCTIMLQSAYSAISEPTPNSKHTDKFERLTGCQVYHPDDDADHAKPETLYGVLDYTSAQTNQLQRDLDGTTHLLMRRRQFDACFNESLTADDRPAYCAHIDRETVGDDTQPQRGIALFTTMSDLWESAAEVRAELAALQSRLAYAIRLVIVDVSTVDSSYKPTLLNAFDTYMAVTVNDNSLASSDGNPQIRKRHDAFITEVTKEKRLKVLQTALTADGDGDYDPSVRPRLFVRRLLARESRLPFDNKHIYQCQLEMSESSAFNINSNTFSHASVLFVSVSFIILMVISLAWLIFYYVQRFRYAHAKDRLARRLFNAAKKALTKIPTRTVRPGDGELDADCPVCIDPYAVGDLVRVLPCKHVFHKTCVDPWLLEHRTCPMCKADILKFFGYNFRHADDGIRTSSRGEERDQVSVDGGSDGARGSSAGDSYAAYPYPSAQHDVDMVGDPFFATPLGSPTLVQQVMNGEQAAGFSIIPLTVHRNSVTRPATTATIATCTSASLPPPAPTTTTTAQTTGGAVGAGAAAAGGSIGGSGADKKWTAAHHGGAGSGSTPSLEDVPSTCASAGQQHHSVIVHAPPTPNGQPHHSGKPSRDPLTSSSSSSDGSQSSSAASTPSKEDTVMLSASTLLVKPNQSDSQTSGGGSGVHLLPALKSGRSGSGKPLSSGCGGGGSLKLHQHRRAHHNAVADADIQQHQVKRQASMFTFRPVTAPQQTAAAAAAKSGAGTGTSTEQQQQQHRRANSVCLEAALPTDRTNSSSWCDASVRSGETSSTPLDETSGLGHQQHVTSETSGLQQQQGETSGSASAAAKPTVAKRRTSATFKPRLNHNPAQSWQQQQQQGGSSSRGKIFAGSLESL